MRTSVARERGTPRALTSQSGTKAVSPNDIIERITMIDESERNAPQRGASGDGGADGLGGGPERREQRKLAGEERGGERRGHGHPDDSPDAARRREKRDDGGPHRDAEVPSHGEDAHSRRAARAGRVVRVAHGLRVEGRDARPGDEDGGRRERVRRRERGGPDPGAREEDSERHEERKGAAVGGRAEERLEDGRDRGRREDEAARGGVREAALGDEERQQRRHGALVGVVHRVRRGEPGEGPAVGGA